MKAPLQRSEPCCLDLSSLPSRKVANSYSSLATRFAWIVWLWEHILKITVCAQRLKFPEISWQAWYLDAPLKEKTSPWERKNTLCTSFDMNHPENAHFCSIIHCKFKCFKHTLRIYLHRNIRPQQSTNDKEVHFEWRTPRIQLLSCR